MNNKARRHLLLAIALASSACSTDEILRIRSLGTTTDPIVQAQSDGAFVGLKQLTTNAKNTNVLFVHGIGWTQEKTTSQFGDDLLRAVVQGFPTAKQVTAKHECGTSTLDGRTERRAKSNGLVIVRPASGAGLQSDDPKFRPQPTELGCLDKFVVDIGADKTVTVYRFLWDDAMWNGAEWFHMAYDDPVAKVNGVKASHLGYDDPDALRASLNSQLKNSVITYGLTDAALYMSPVGHAMREGVQAALCVAIAGSFDSVIAKNPVVSASELCAVEPSQKAPLMLVSHSLGSRIVFDTLKTDLTETLAQRISAGVSNDQLEVHMLANQIPLVGVGRLGSDRSRIRIENKSLAIIAYSEINDLLTYELVPYFEHLFYVRCYGEKLSTSGCNASAEQEFAKRAGPLPKETRRAIVGELGFDVIDVRLRFAPNKFFFYSGLKDPGVAHSGHLGSESAISLLLCGAENGKPRLPFQECQRR